MPTTYSGTMTEMKRVDNDSGPSVVVSYWTNDQGERYEPRLRFVLGDKNRPVKGLTRAQALSVRDAFNAICAEWETGSAPKKRATKSKAKKQAGAEQASAKVAADDAAAAIVSLFKSKDA